MRYLAYFMWTLIVLAVFIVIGLFIYAFGPVYHGSESEWHVSTLYFIFLICGYLPASIRSVDITETAGIMFYGKYLTDAPKGVHFIPLGVFQLRKENGTVVSLNFPAEPELVFKGPDDQPLPDGMFRATRVTTASADTADLKLIKDVPVEDIKKDDLHVRITLEPSWLIRFRIINYQNFLRNIGSMENLVNALRDTSERGLNGEFNRRTVVMINLDRNDIDEELLKSLKNLVGDTDTPDPETSWGVQIQQFHLLDPDYSKAVNAAIAKNAAQPILNKATVSESVANATKILNEGKATAKVATDLFTGTTHRTNQANIEIAKHTKKGMTKFKGKVLAITNSAPATTIPLKAA